MSQQQPPPIISTGADSAQNMAQTSTAQYPQESAQVPPPQGVASHTVPPDQTLGVSPNSHAEESRPSMQLDYGDDPSNAVHYTRDPRKLTAYLVPFPRPHLKDEAAAAKIPPRFLIYTPPPPPIAAPREGEKEGRAHKLQRKWQEEVRTAKTSDAKVASWKGIKGRATKGIDWAMGQVKTSNLEFLNRIPGQSSGTEDKHADDGHDEGDTTHKTVGLSEMLLVYPASVPGTQEQLREEFISSMLRSKSKAEKDAIIATGLIPVSLCIDLLATLVWPFGGLAEVDTVWAAASIRGAKNARSVTKRLASSQSETQPAGGQSAGLGSKLTSMIPGQKGQANAANDQKLRLTFIPSQRIETLDRYLASECHRRDARHFASAGPAPTETDVVQAIGWSPSQTGGETKNWEDEQWELTEVKEDIKAVMKKGAREWDKWVKAYEKDPEKALRK